MRRPIVDLRTRNEVPSRPIRSLPRAGLMVCLLGVLVMPLGAGPTSALEPGSGSPRPEAWSGWRQQHLELEYPASATVLAGPHSVAWADWRQQHLELEYPV
jgi:hypothetical protein